MDGVEPSTDFQGWELLQADSESESEKFLPEIDSGGLIQANSVSLEAKSSFGEDDKSAISDNPSWIEPALEEVPARYLHKDSAEFWSDSSTEGSEDHKFTDSERVNEVCCGDVDSITEESELGTLYLDSGGTGNGSGVYPVAEILGEERNGGVEESVKTESRTREVEKKGIVWWKMPLEFLKHCVFRMTPVSIAAAVMGFVILAHRLYKMRNKARTLELKVAVDDKKVSQAMSRAARLNEAFSIVKLVPVIRFSAPAAGSPNLWPVTSLR